MRNGVPSSDGKLSPKDAVPIGDGSVLRPVQQTRPHQGVPRLKRRLAVGNLTGVGNVGYRVTGDAEVRLLRRDRMGSGC